MSDSGSSRNRVTIEQEHRELPGLSTELSPRDSKPRKRLRWPCSPDGQAMSKAFGLGMGKRWRDRVWLCSRRVKKPIGKMRFHVKRFSSERPPMLLVTSASLVVTSALLVVTRSY